MPDLSSVALPAWAWLALQIVLIVVVAFIALRFTNGFVHGIFKTLLDREAREGTAQDLTSLELRKRMETLDALGANLLQFFIVVIAALMILGRLGLDIGPAVAGLGIVGIAVGFGAQSLVKDYFNGALILIENQYTKGDVIRIAGVEGTVEDLTLRRTTLRDFDGNVHTVPNSAIVVASNLTRGWARINEELQVPTADLVDEASEVVDRIGREMAADPVWQRRLLEPPHVDRIDALGPTGITLHIAGRVQAAHRWTAIGELRRRLLLAFRERNLPFVPGGAVGGGLAGHTIAPVGADTGAGSTGTPASAGGEAAVVTGSAGLDTTARSAPALGQDDLAQGTD